MRTRFWNGALFAVGVLALFLAGCLPSPPSATEAQREFEAKFPAAKVQSFVLKDPSLPRTTRVFSDETKVFIVTYTTAENPKSRTVEFPYERHGVTNNWVQVPPVNSLN